MAGSGFHFALSDAVGSFKICSTLVVPEVVGSEYGYYEVTLTLTFLFLLRLVAPSLSFEMLFALLLPVLLLIRPNIAGYVLLDDYNATTFFDMFNFFTDADPTGGAGMFIVFEGID